MAVREFSLVNDLGQTFSLMDIDNYAYLSKPSGLGFSYSASYVELGNVFATSTRDLSQNSITGTMYFKNYENYRKLINFIHKSTKLILSYLVPYEKSTKTYYRDIEINNLSKGDKEKNGLLKSSITFTTLSLWYEKTNTKYVIEDDDDLTVWDFYFDSSYFLFNSCRDLEYINEGDINASVVINVDGEVINPTLRLYIEGELQQEIKIKTTIKANEKLCYSSKEDDFYIKKQNEDGTYTSLFNLDFITFENDNVIRIPPGKQCRLTITADDSVDSADLMVYTYYTSV